MNKSAAIKKALKKPSVTWKGDQRASKVTTKYLPFKKGQHPLPHKK